MYRKVLEIFDVMFRYGFDLNSNVFYCKVVNIYSIHNNYYNDTVAKNLSLVIIPEFELRSIQWDLR
jgi:hypothetical protein